MLFTFVAIEGCGVNGNIHIPISDTGEEKSTSTYNTLSYSECMTSINLYNKKQLEINSYKKLYILLVAHIHCIIDKRDLV
jgi:hypothetical protein